MDSKLQNILELALRPDTQEHESLAAFRAARRLVAKQGLPSWKGNPKTVVKYIEKEVFVFDHAFYDCESSFILIVKNEFKHDMLQRIFLDAYTLNCMTYLTSCELVDPDDDRGGLKITFTVKGYKSDISIYNQAMQVHVDRMNRNIKPQAVKRTGTTVRKLRKSWVGKFWNKICNL